MSSLKSFNSHFLLNKCYYSKATAKLCKNAYLVANENFFKPFLNKQKLYLTEVYPKNCDAENVFEYSS